MRKAAAFAVMMVLGVCSTVIGATGEVDLPRHPSISPDGKTIVFSWRGDLWSVPSSGGHAARLTVHPADETQSVWSRDGKAIAFMSDRAGAMNIYLMNPDGTNVRPVTDTDRSCSLSSFSADGAEVWFTSSREGDVYRAVRPYRASTQGGPIERLMDVFADAPAPSPNGRWIAFERGGADWWRTGYRHADSRNLWLYDTQTSAFRRITDRPGNDGQARWQDDKTLIFASDREDNTVNLYALGVNEDESRARRLTRFDHDHVDSFDVSADGSTAVLAAWDGLYTLNLRRRGAEPVRLSITATSDESDDFELKSIDREVSEAALSPDGKVMAVVAYGEVYVRSVEEGSPTRRIELGESREREIAWSPCGVKLYFVSDMDGTDSIYAATVKTTRGELRKAVRAGATQATEDTPEPADEPADPPDEPAEDEADDGKEAEEENGADDTEKDAKKKDEKKESPADRWRDAIRFDVAPVVTSAFNDRMPTPSPDGKTLAFRRTRGDIVLLDLESGEERTFLESFDFGVHFAWSPLSDALAYTVNDYDYNADIWIAPVEDASRAVNITRHPDREGSPRFSADGRVLAFLSTRINDQADVWMVYLDKDVEAKAKIDLEKYYKDAADAAKKRKPLAPPSDADGDKDKKKEGDSSKEPVVGVDPSKPLAFTGMNLDDAYLRLRRITSLLGDESNLALTPGGDRYIFTANDTAGDGTSNRRGLYSVKWTGEDRKRLSDAADVRHVSLTGDKVVLVSTGRAATVGPGGEKLEYLDVSDRMRIDLRAQAEQKFLETSRILGDGFYHNELKGLDWGWLTERYLELAQRSRTNSEFRAVALGFIGRLNGSHLNVTPRSAPNPNTQANGRLGVDLETVDGGFRVTRVLDRGPSAAGPMALRVGDVITGIEFRGFENEETVESRLKGRAGVETVVSVRRTEADGAARELDLLLTPIGYGAEVGLRYDAWQRDNAAKVHEWSNGRLGYLHIRAMGLNELYEFERDLYAAADGREGLIVDVRNNGGGWTADFVLASLMVREHAYTVPRGGDVSRTGHYPRDRLFIQRYVRPVNMLCNEKSYSNAEIISHAFKTLGRGTLVGQPTHGSVISTGGSSLIDGTWVRLPFRGWYLPDGTDMEDGGAAPDLLVPQTPEDEAAGDDRQLRAAVEDLLGRLE